MKRLLPPERPFDEPPGTVWLHIDHFDKKSRNVWALQYWDQDKPVYRVASRVISYGVIWETVYRKGRRQPKAWLRTEGVVEWYNKCTAAVRSASAGKSGTGSSKRSRTAPSALKRRGSYVVY